MAGLGPGDVDVAEFYDPFSFEIIRQLEAYGFCEPGEGGPMVESGAIGPGGEPPGHHRRRHHVLQPPRGRGPAVPAGGAWVSASSAASARRMQVAGAEVALCSNGGSGALFTDVMLLGE